MTSTPALDSPATGVHAPPGSTPIYVITYPERLPVAELEETIALAEQQLRHVLGPDAGILVLDQGATLAGPVWEFRRVNVEGLAAYELPRISADLREIADQIDATARTLHPGADGEGE